MGECWGVTAGRLDRQGDGQSEEGALSRLENNVLRIRGRPLGLGGWDVGPANPDGRTHIPLGCYEYQ